MLLAYQDIPKPQEYAQFFGVLGGIIFLGAFAIFCYFKFGPGGSSTPKKESSGSHAAPVSDTLRHLEKDIKSLEDEVQKLRDWRHERAGDKGRIEAMWEEFCARHKVK